MPPKRRGGFKRGHPNFKRICVDNSDSDSSPDITLAELQKKMASNEAEPSAHVSDNDNAAAVIVEKTVIDPVADPQPSCSFHVPAQKKTPQPGKKPRCSKTGKFVSLPVHEGIPTSSNIVEGDNVADLSFAEETGRNIATPVQLVEKCHNVVDESIDPPQVLEQKATTTEQHDIRAVEVAAVLPPVELFDCQDEAGDVEQLAPPVVQTNASHGEEDVPVLQAEHPFHPQQAPIVPAQEVADEHVEIEHGHQLPHVIEGVDNIPIASPPRPVVENVDDVGQDEILVDENVIDDNVIADNDEQIIDGNVIVNVPRHLRRTHGVAFIPEDGGILENQIPPNNIGTMHRFCGSCEAKLFEGEVNPGGLGGKLCCFQGKVMLDNIPDCHPDVVELLTTPNVEYRDKIRMYNASLSFASFGARFDILPPAGHYVFRISGTPHHLIGPMHPAPGRQPRNSQLYFVDNATASGLRAERFPECNRNLLQALDALLREINPYCAIYRMIHDVEEEEQRVAGLENRPIRPIVMVLKNRADIQVDRRYDMPTANEVAIVFRGEVPETLPNLRIYQHDRRLRTLSMLSSETDPLVYPLLFQRGEQGYVLNTPHAIGRGNVSMREFCAYRIAVREQFNVIISSGKLFHQYLVDSWVRIEHGRIVFVKTHQQQLRAELYNGLVDHLNRAADHQQARVGRMVILPNTFGGSPRNQYEHYLDAITIFKNVGSPTFFITFTCNPNWIDIQRELQRYEVAGDRPDVVARVFRQKLTELMTDLTDKHILGVSTAHMYAIEFQKRGLPHAHIVLGVQPADGIFTNADVDRCVTAEIPDREVHPRLAELVKNHMFHGPCGALNPRNVCMVDGVCTKKYPRQFTNETIYNLGGRPIYRRRNDGRNVEVGTRQRVLLDNRYIVPYNPYLLLKYDAHINVEICSGQKWVKYLFKYCFKGRDCLSVALAEADEGRILDYDECDAYVDGRYVTAPEAYWRIASFYLWKMSHTVQKLPVHLPGQHLVLFDADNVADVMRNPNVQNTRLTAFFRLNAEDADANQYLYREIPLHYLFNDRTKTWQRRVNHSNATSRLYSINVKDRERYALHLLLNAVRGPRSFEHVRTVDGVVHDTFLSAAQAMHLIEDNLDSINCMNEAVHYRFPPALRRLFVTLCVYNQVDAATLWEMFCEPLSEDFVNRRRLDIERAKNAALTHIDLLLKYQGSSCLMMGLPLPEVAEAEPLHVDVGGEDEIELVNGGEHPPHRVDALNFHQRRVFDAILQAVDLYSNMDRHTVKAFFIDGVGGSGKSFLYETMYATLNARNEKVISVATSGIAATLLSGGQTVHSAFRLPLNIDENTTCNISMQSPEADNIRQAVVVLCDEASMMNCNILHAIDRFLRCVMESDCIFGGKVVVLGGDFRQILPIVRNGSRSQQVEACLKNSPIWPSFRCFHLAVNMRAAEADGAYSQWVENIGNGAMPRLQYRDPNNRLVRLPPTAVEIPQQLLAVGNIDEWVFEDLTADNISSCAVLCPRNVDVDEINDRVLNRLPGEAKSFYSSYSQPDDVNEEHALLPLQLIQEDKPSGLPPHHLILKSGAIVMLLRNIDITGGLVNGTRLMVQEIQDHVLKCVVVSGPKRGRIALLGRLSLQANDSALNYKRTQFPVRLSYGMTINKAQGQTLARVGLYLPQPCFCHGQLYVALSRCRSFDDLKILVCDTRHQGRIDAMDATVTPNIVYREVLTH